MLKMSKLTDYGTLIMTYLARDPQGVHAANEIAAMVGVTLPTVTKVLKMLAREGLLTSHRGIHGGYVLARTPAQITMAQIVVALEGPIGLTECGTAPGSCERERSCGVKTNWQRISQAVIEALTRVTLAEMAIPTHTVQVQRPARRPAPAIPA